MATTDFVQGKRMGLYAYEEDVLHSRVIQRCFLWIPTFSVVSLFVFVSIA
jgi:hypothetical protein